MDRLRAWWNGLRNPTKAALNTTWQTFFAVFGLSLLGWIADVAEWAGSTATEFPSISPLGKAAVSAACAALSGLITWVVRTLQTMRATSRGVLAGPQYPPAT